MDIPEEIQQQIVNLQNQINNLTSLVGKNQFSNTQLVTGEVSQLGGGYQSANFVTGSTGWRFDALGNLEANAGTFRGALTANSISIGSGANWYHVDNAGNTWWGNYATYALAVSGGGYRISAAGAANLSGLTVGTNVGIGSAFPSASAGDLATLDAIGTAQLDSTVIVGGYIKTSLIEAGTIVAGSVAAENITGTYITGKIVRTGATSTFRSELRKSGETLGDELVFVSSGNVDLAHIGGLNDGTLKLSSGASEATYFYLTVTGSEIGVKGHLIPYTNNTYDLGASSYGWKDLHMSGHIIGRTPYQYSESVDFENGTYTITCGFAPKKVHLYGCLYATGTYVTIGTTYGQAGVVAPTAGACSAYTIQGNSGGTYDFILGTNDYLGGNSTCYVYVTAWHSDHIHITCVAPGNWVLPSKLVIEG